MTTRTLPFLLAISFATAVAILAMPTQATAMDLQAGVAGRIGGATVEDSDVSDDSNTGFGGGAKVWAALKFIDYLAVGLNVDFAGSSHTFDSAVGDIDVSLTAFSFGALIRSELAPEFALDFWVNYALGEAESEAGGFSATTDEDGVLLGLDAMYRFQIGAYKTWVEVGPYFTYGSFSNDNDNDNGLTYLGFGAVAQGTFEFGL